MSYVNVQQSLKAIDDLDKTIITPQSPDWVLEMIASADPLVIDGQPLLVRESHNSRFFFVTLNVAQLSAPVVLIDSENLTVVAGSSAIFFSDAFGLPGPTAQWQENTVDLTGEIYDVLTLTSVTPAMDGNTYQVVWTNSQGTVTSASATLTVHFAPTITSDPSNQSVTEGQDATFTVASDANPAPTYQWQVDTGSGFGDIGGETSDTLVVTTVLGDDGNVYRCVVTNTIGSATSAEATLTVTPTP